MLTIKPISLAEANAYVINNHRHNGKVQIHKFSIAVYDDDRLCAVAIVGRPVARALDDGMTLEVRRLCTDGTKNVCSMLYSRCAKIAKDMGYAKIITYILESEYGSSLKASNWELEAEHCGGVSWNHPSRPRYLVDPQLSFFGENKPKYPTGYKKRYVKKLD